MIILATCILALAATAYAAPFMPAGGADTATNSTPPVYVPGSDFDFQSLNLALNQEWIELDLFHYGLAKFSPAEFEAAGLTPNYQFLIEFMADQEVAHATLLSNILQGKGAKRCKYKYDFETVSQFLDFCQKLTRFGEAGVYGFLPHLDSRPSAQVLLQSITTEARQQMAFRQFKGLFPMPVDFETGITQSMAWTLLSPYISSCPASNPRIEWQHFPQLYIDNNPNSSFLGKAAVSTNRTSLSEPGRTVNLTWKAPGERVGYDGLYTTNSTAGPAKYVAWISQLNTTYTALTLKKNTTGSTIQPGGFVLGNNTAAIVNDTMFIAITDSNLYVTPYNLSMLNSHIVAGPALYQAD